MLAAGVLLTILPASFTCWLVEPGLYVKLPLLLEVLVWNNVVVRHHPAALGSCVTQKRSEVALQCSHLIRATPT